MRPDPMDPAADFAVQWFFVPWDRAGLGVPTAFTSSTWDDFPFAETVGELRASRTWSKGAALFSPQVEPPGLCGTADQWLNGYPLGTPGCEVDPATGVCKDCGPVAVGQAVGLAWGVGEGIGQVPVAWAEGAASALDVRRSDAVTEVWGALSVYSALYPDAVAEAYAVGALVRVKQSDIVAEAYAVGELLNLKRADQVAEAWAPGAVIGVDFADAVAEAFALVPRYAVADLWPVATACAVGGAAELPMAQAVGEVMGPSDIARPRIPGLVAMAEGPSAPGKAFAPTAVAVAMVCDQVKIPTRLNAVSQVEGAAAVTRSGRIGAAAEASAVQSAKVFALVGPAAEVFRPTSAVQARLQSGAGYIYGVFEAHQVAAPSRVAQVEGAGVRLRYWLTTAAASAWSPKAPGVTVAPSPAAEAWRVLGLAVNAPQGRAAEAWKVGQNLTTLAGSLVREVYQAAALVTVVSPVQAKKR
jgi:hypothetical protein